MLLFTHHHQCGNPSHIFELHARGKAQVYLSHLLLAKGGDCKLLPSPWPTSPKSTHPRLQTFARRLASVCLSCPFFRLRPCSASTGAVVWWGWHPRSLLTERRMVVHPGAGSFPTPPPPTRPPHGPDAASRPLASKTQKSISWTLAPQAQIERWYGHDIEVTNKYASCKKQGFAEWEKHKRQNSGIRREAMVIGIKIP